MEVRLAHVEAVIEGFGLQIRALASEFERAFQPLVDLAQTLKSIEPIHDWWPLDDDEWLRFAIGCFRRRRYRLAVYCIRRAFRAHCEATR